MDDPDPSDPPTPPSRAPLARVALVRKRVAFAAPVRVVVVEAPTERRPPARAAVAGGSVWVMQPEHAVEEIPLGE